MICPDVSPNKLENFDIAKISNDINKQKYEIISILGDLKDYLTSSDLEKRANGMNILSSILNELKSDICNEQEVQSLLDYYSHRIGDNVFVIKKSLSGLDALCHFHNFKFEMASSLFFLIQNELPLQILDPDNKLIVYKLIDYLFNRYKSEFITLGSNFIYAFLRIIDTETSPTCLAVIFKLFEEISSRNEFELFSEDLFDSMACYFPIIYSQSKNDKYFETKIQLSNLLNRAMTCTTKFAKFVFQISLEKLDSQSLESKKSCYKLLQLALPKYSPKDVKEFVSDLWISIRIDTLKCKIENDKLAKNALTTLTKLSDTLNTDLETLEMLREKIWTDLEISIKMADLQLALSSCKILTSFSSTNVDLFDNFFKRSIPLIIDNFIFADNVKNQQLYLQSYFTMVEHGRKIGAKFNLSDVLKDITLLTENSNNRENDIRKMTILILNEYIQACDIELDCLRLIVNFSVNWTQQSGFNSKLSNVCFLLFENLSKKYSIKDICLDNLMDEFELLTMMDEERIYFHLNLLRSSCQESTITLMIIEFLINRLFIMKSDMDNQIFFNAFSNILETFQICLNRFSSDSQFLMEFQVKCIEKLLKFFVQIAFVEQRTMPDMFPRMFTELFFNFLQLINKDNWQAITEKCLLAWRIMDASKLHEYFQTPLPIDNGNVFQNTITLCLIYSCFKSSDNQFSINTLLETFEQINFNNKLTAYSDELIKITSKITSDIILKLKQMNYIELENLLKKYLQFTQSSFLDDPLKNERNILLMNSLIWIGKSLFLTTKNEDDYFIKFVAELFNLECKNDLMKNCLTEMIDVFYSNNDFWQTFHSNETLIPMDTFSINLHQLICDKYNETNDNTYLYILLSNLKFIPTEQFNTNQNQYLPFIINGLKLKDCSQINLLGLTFLNNILETSPNLIEAQVITILELIIEMAKKNILVVRIKALDCITKMIDLFGEKHFLNLRQQLIQKLRPTLADHKRLVRSSAIKCFFKMSTLGQPGT